MTIGIVADSTGCVPADLAAELGIEVVPLSVAMDGVTYHDGVDLTPAEFYRRLAAGPPFPTTSAAGVSDFVAAYQRMADRGYPEIVSIVLSGSLSATYDAARTAAEQVDVPVRVVDSRTVAAPHGMAVVAAARRAAEGASADEVVARTQEAAAASILLAVIPDLTHLYRGGRINAVQAGIGNLLRITPVVTIRDGAVTPIARERTLRRALDRMLAIAGEVADGQRTTVWVMEAGAHDLAAQLGDRLAAEIDVADFRMTTFTPVMGAHTGPGTAGFGIMPGSL